MNYYSIPHLISSLLNLLLIFFILINNRKKNIIFSYILINLTGLFWNSALFLLYNIDDYQTGLLLNHFIVCLTMLLFPSFYFFTINFVEKLTKLNKFLLVLAYALAILFILFHFKFHILSNDVKKYFWGYYPVEGIGDRIYALTFSCYTIYSLILIYQLIKNSTGQKRNQSKYIFWSFLFGYACFQYYDLSYWFFVKYVDNDWNWLRINYRKNG
jgi:hypothetical protein